MIDATFLGAAGTVTGSRFLFESNGTRILVDCGLFQGRKRLRERNWEPLPVDPASIDAVVLTHAHVDHSGWLPVLVREGFSGPIHATGPTLDLCRILLPDAARLQEEDAAYANRKGFTRHAPALPLFTLADARRVEGQLVSHPFDQGFNVGAATVRFQPAGHILGAASVRLDAGGRSVLVSGDLGRPHDLIMRPPAPPGDPDFIVLESTYGDRLHADDDPVAGLGAIVSRTAERGGVLLIPAFAVGRSQAILWALHLAFQRGLAPRVPVALDSPMAANVTRLYQGHARYHRLSKLACRQMTDVARIVTSPAESKELSASRGPRVVVSASGMLTGGRVLHHLKAFAPDPANTVLLAGFQAPGTRGDALLSGAGTVKVHGEHISVRAEVAQLDLFSAHADRDELLEWLGSCRHPPVEVLLVHGERPAAAALQEAIGARFAFGARIVDHREHVRLA